MLTLNRPESALGVLMHSIFDGLEQFCHCFDRKFVSHELDFFLISLEAYDCHPQLCVAFFRPQSSLWHGQEKPYPADSSALGRIRRRFSTAPVTQPNHSLQRPYQARSTMDYLHDAAEWREWCWCEGFGCRFSHRLRDSQWLKKSATLSRGLHWLFHCLLWCSITWRILIRF